MTAPHGSKQNSSSGSAAMYRPDVHGNLRVEEVLLLLWTLAVHPNFLFFEFSDHVQRRSHLLLQQNTRGEMMTFVFLQQHGELFLCKKNIVTITHNNTQTVRAPIFIVTAGKVWDICLVTHFSLLRLYLACFGS